MILINDYYTLQKFPKGSTFLSKSLFKPYQEFTTIDITHNSLCDARRFFAPATNRYTYYCEAESHSRRVDPSRSKYLYKAFFTNLSNLFITDNSKIKLEEIKAANALYDQNDIIDRSFYKIIYAQLNSQYKLIKINTYEDEELDYYKEIVSKKLSLDSEYLVADLKEKALEFFKFIFNVANNIYYLRKFENEATYQELPIFYNFNKNIYSLLKDSIVRTNRTYIPYTSLYAFENLSLDSTSKLYIDNNKNYLTISDYPTDFSSITYDEIEPLLNEKQKAILVKSWSKKSDSPIELKEYKKSFFKRRKGFFLPLSSNFEYLDKDLSLKPALFFGLSLNENNSNKTIYSKINSSKVSKRAFSNLLEALFQYNGLYFLDNDEFLKRKIKEFATINENIAYSNNLSEATKTYLNFLKEKKSYIDSKITPYSTNKYISETLLKKFISNPKRDESVEKAISKIDKKLKLTSGLLQQNILQLETNALKNRTALTANFCKHYYQFYWNLQQLSNNISFDFNNLDYSNYFNQSIKKHDLVETQKELINKNFELNIFSYDEVLFKMLQEIKVVDISYSPAQTSEPFKYDSSKIKRLSFNNHDSIHSPIKRITCVEYLIDKILPVYIDGKVSPIAIKAIGPLYVRVAANKIHIKIKDNKTLFGVISQNSEHSYIKLHPHSNAGSISNNWQNCCLGEASSLLYKAFEKNDLKEILLATLVWLTSGNSADVWGKSYKFFPDYSDCIIEQPNSEEINKQEISSFLNQEIEENDFIDIQEPEESTPPVQEVQQTNTYVRYLQ